MEYEDRVDEIPVATEVQRVKPNKIVALYPKLYTNELACENDIVEIPNTVIVRDIETGTEWIGDDEAIVRRQDDVRGQSTHASNVCMCDDYRENIQVLHVRQIRQAHQANQLKICKYVSISLVSSFFIIGIVYGIIENIRTH
jgi:hypothetical protein